MRAGQGVGGIGLALMLCGALAACGGGGGSGGGGTGSSSSSSSGGPVFTSGVYAPASTYVNQCQTPRTGTDPYSHVAYPDRAGSTLLENYWLRSWNNDLYLWYSEVTDVNPAAYSNTLDYFAQLKTFATTASGADKDKFHFTYPTAEWESLSNSGVDVGYGISWVLISSTPPREARAALVEPGTTAASDGVSRGDEVVSVDGVGINDNTSAGIDTLNEGLFPTVAGTAHTIVLQPVGGGANYSVTLTPAAIATSSVYQPIAISTGTGAVGYLLFNDHLAPAEQEFATAIATLKADNVTDLVLDMRYNGGGYLDIASEAAYMIAGPANTAGKNFETTVFNDKHPTVDPVTGQTITPTPFITTAEGFSETQGTALPYLGLSRVFVLTGPDTCSASESVINGLRGAGVTVIQIGSTTCGKPYGFYPQDNCGTTYFSIQFQGVNNAGFGDYPDGFAPANQTPSNVGYHIPGCSVADDFTHQLGDVAEARLAAALAYRASGATGTCPAATGVSGRASILSTTAGAGSDAAHEDGRLVRSPLREIRILGKPRT
ncbi:MAG TPA: S41 family peptidase [Steroidobacteraceae bacterium]|nr:S41 family peptidase [Steroidobacteraceae bacterium]